ncbi:MAG TPA: FAD-binding oxidoreductase, partial [Candidatus Limnocylindria bacterium]|nr:FAD-binding oxidoreductase [Candidatus Limnocylindria bacterium]
MEQVTVAALAGGVRQIARRQLDDLAANLRGQVLYPADEGFAGATTIWNGMIKKSPAAVLQPESAEDVVQAVIFARDNGLELAIKGGGHNIAGLALSDGGVVLDMARLRQVDVDPDARLARVGAGCNLGDVDRATQAHGLATTLGFVSLTGIAGLTVGGGFGYLSRRFGWTTDDLEEVEVVTADGQLRRASRTQDEDLFWAIRGGGGNFGVVTEFVFRLHPIGPQVMAGPIAWPAAEAESVVEVFRRTAETSPRELTLVVARRNAPPAPWLPEAAHGTPVVMIIACHSGSLDQAAADLAAIKSHGQPLADLIQPKEYVAQQSMLDATMPNGNYYYWKSEFVPGLSDDLLRAYNEQFVGMKAPANQGVLFQIDGALNEQPEDDGAVGNRDAAFACVLQSMWRPETDAEAGASNREWVRRGWQAIKPFSTGGNYVNFQTADDPDERTQESYRANYRRLEEVKARHDPDNVFRVNR